MKDTGMKDTILSNTGCRCVFQVSGTDARDLLLELGRRHLTEDDITQQAPYHCYVRSTGPKDFIPTYSMALLPPDQKSKGVAEVIRKVSMRFTRRNDEVAAELMARMGPMDKYDDPALGNSNATVEDIIRTSASAQA